MLTIASTYNAEGVDTVATVIGIALAVILHFGPVVVSYMKGRYVLGSVGIIFGIFAWVGMFRLARPNSWWFNRYYVRTSNGTRSRERFAKTPATATA